MYLLLEADRRPVLVVVLLDVWMYGWCLWDMPDIFQCVFHTWSCTVWSEYDNGSSASAAPSGLAWHGHERPADERDMPQRSGLAAVAQVLTAGCQLVLHYSSLASTWRVQAPAVSWLLLRHDGISDTASAAGSSTPMTLWQRVPSLIIALRRAGPRDPERLILVWSSRVRLLQITHGHTVSICSYLNRTRWLPSCQHWVEYGERHTTELYSDCTDTSAAFHGKMSSPSPSYIWPKLTHTAVVQSLCDSWASCY